MQKRNRSIIRNGFAYGMSANRSITCLRQEKAKIRPGIANMYLHARHHGNAGIILTNEILRAALSA